MRTCKRCCNVGDHIVDGPGQDLIKACADDQDCDGLRMAASSAVRRTGTATLKHSAGRETVHACKAQCTP